MTVIKEKVGPLNEFGYIEGAVGNYARDYVGQSLMLEHEESLSPSENSARKDTVLLTVGIAARLIHAPGREIIDIAIAYDSHPERFTYPERVEIGSYYDYYDKAKKVLVEDGLPIDRAEVESIKALRVVMVPRAVRDGFSKLERAKRKQINGLRLEVACEFVQDVVYRFADGNYRQ